MIAMNLMKPKTETEATVLISCETCGLTSRYGDARNAGWVAVGGGPWRYRCCGCQPESLEFVDDPNQCDGCRRGMPVDEHGTHYGEDFDMIACTRNRYKKIKTECRTCGHIEYHERITDFAEERCDNCNSLSFGQKTVTRG